MIQLAMLQNAIGILEIAIPIVHQDAHHHGLEITIVTNHAWFTNVVSI